MAPTFLLLVMGCELFGDNIEVKGGCYQLNHAGERFARIRYETAEHKAHYIRAEKQPSPLKPQSEAKGLADT